MLLYAEIDQIVSTTHDTCNLFTEYKNGGDMLLLYFRYILQWKLQENINTYSEDSFMQNSMGWGRDRFRKAKNGLKELKLIEMVEDRCENGTINKKYVKVKYIVATQPKSLENLPTENPTVGKTTTNTLDIKLNTLVIKENTISPKNSSATLQENEYSPAPDFQEFWNIYPNKKGKQKAIELRNKLTTKDKQKAIAGAKQYAEEKKGEDIKYIKHGNTFLSQKSYEDYVLTREELKAQMRSTRHRDSERPETAYGRNYKDIYEAMFGEQGFDWWFEDKESIKQPIEAMRKQHRLSHNGKDMSW